MHWPVSQASLAWSWVPLQSAQTCLHCANHPLGADGPLPCWPLVPAPVSPPPLLLTTIQPLALKHMSHSCFFVFCLTFFFGQSTSLSQINERKQSASWPVFSTHWMLSWTVPIILMYSVFVLRALAIIRCFSLFLLHEAQNCNMCCKTHTFVS